MKVLIYAKQSSTRLELLRRVIEKVITEDEIKEFNNVNILCKQFKKSTITENYEAITILFIGDRKELQKLLEIHSQLKETRIILILPDKEIETIQSGHKLLPRYLDFIDSNFIEVGEVLKKMNQANSKRT